MAETYSELYSVGPGSVGPGTSVVRSETNPQKNRGVITYVYKNDAGISTAALSGLSSLPYSEYPGTSIPLSHTTVKLVSDKLALIVATYGQSSGNGFKTVMTRKPIGFRDIPAWPRDATKLSEWASKSYNYTGRRLNPERIERAPLISISWSTVVYSDQAPADNKNLIGKVNSNAYTIDQYYHAPNTLRFDGTYVRHDKYGGYDRWTRTHTATYDPYWYWRVDDVKLSDEPLSQNHNGKEVYDATRPDPDGKALYEEITFPDLP